MKHLESFYRGKRVLVTGGAGFIGSHLVERLVELGAHVTVLDNFSTGNLNNLRSVFSNLTILYTDVSSSYNALKATLNKDIVFHLAAFISVPQSIQQPALCNKINTQGTKNILDGCVQNKVPMVVYSSSSAVYGNKNNSCSEHDQPQPLTPYAKSKLAAEKLCADYALEHNLKTASLRYFNVYGDRQNPQGPYASVVAKFKQLLKEGKPLTIYGDGNQTRDFVHVSDVVEANLQIGALDQAQGEVFNIGSGKSITLFQLIEQLKQELAIDKSSVVFHAPRDGDILHSQANCSKYMRVIASR